MRPYLVFTFFLCFHFIFGQVVDKTRLEFEEDQLTARQVGMSITSDKKLAAFLLDNGELKIMDLFASAFIKTYNIPVNDAREILFTKDDEYLIIAEDKKVRLVDWKSGEILFTQSYDYSLQAVRASSFSNHFAVAFESSVEIWDIASLNKERSLEIKQEITTISLSPFSTKIIVSPKWSIIRNQVYMFDYETGKELEKYIRRYMGSFDNMEDRMYHWQNNTIPGYGPATPIYGHRSVSNPKDYQALIAFDGKQEKNSDVGIYLTTYRVKDKIIAAAGYRGFSVFDFNKGGKIFTTKKTKRDRSYNGFEVLKEYVAIPHYPLNEDIVLINAYGDNINQIYSASQNEIIGYIFIDGNGEYAVVSRDGRFDGTSGSTEKLYWTARKSLKKTSLESTFNRGFTPKLLRNIISGEETIAALDLETAIENIPSIEINAFDGAKVSKGSGEGIIQVSTSNKNVQIGIQITENIAEVAVVKLFHNGKLVAVDENPSTQTTFNLNLTNALGEDNFIYAMATSKAGIDTEKRKMQVKYLGSSDDPPIMYLITVGVNEYRNPKYNLNYAIADADALSLKLSEQSSGIFQEVKHIAIRNQNFTKPKMMEVFNELTSATKEQDLLIFYYAGHGVMSKGLDVPAEFFLVPHDITQIYGRDDLLFEKGISANELREASKNINAQKQLFILDACQSAAALDAIASRGVQEEKAIAQLARSTGTFWITATGSEQFATEFQTLGHGVFTYAMLEGLEGKADGLNKDNKITVREISAYIEAMVPELSEQYHGTPQFPSSYSFGQDFPIVIYE